MNQINPAKLLNSKWTAVKPLNREKHFLVSEIEFDEEGLVVLCKLEAVLSNKEYTIEWVELKNQDKWLQGWKQCNLWNRPNKALKPDCKHLGGFSSIGTVVISGLVVFPATQRGGIFRGQYEQI